MPSLMTETVINVSQDAVTSPAPSAPEVARTLSPPSKQKAQNNNAITREGSAESTQIVKETLEDIPENYPQRKYSPPSTPARPAPPDESEDLYDATPLTQRRKPPPEPLATGRAAEHTQAIAEALVINVETQKEGAATTSSQPPNKGPKLSQLSADDPDRPAEANTAKATPKPKILTQNSRSDKLEPAPGTSTDPPASTTGRNNSNQSSAQFGTPRNASAGSKTSAMASAAKSAAATLKKSKTQPAATGTSAKAKLEAMKAAQPGTSASAAPAPTNAASTTQGPPRVRQQVQAGSTKATTSQVVEDKASVVADDGLDNEQPAPPGKLPRLSKPTLATKALASMSKNAPKNDDPTAKEQPAVAATKSVSKSTKIVKEGRLDGISERKQKARPLVKDDDETDGAGEAHKSTQRGDSEIDSDEPITRTRHSLTAPSRKRKADDKDLHENDDGVLGTARHTRKRPGGLADASATIKRHKQAVTSSWNDDDGDGEYEVPVSSVKKTTKKGKAPSKAKAVSPRRTTRPTKNAKAQPEASNHAKAPGSNRAVAKMEVDATADEQRATLGEIAKHVRGQGKGPKKAVVGTKQSPQTRGDDVPRAAGSKAKGKKVVSRINGKGDNLPAKEGSAPSPGPNANGETQDDAIVLSDNEDKSSSYAGSLTPKKPTATTRHEPSAQRTSAVPKTPALQMRSSPPDAMKDDARQLADLQRTIRGYKPSFIEFDKSGPRNQGVAAVKTPGQRSVKRASVAPSVKRKNDLSSFATTVRSGRLTQRASSSNIASNVDDALSNLAKKQTKPAFEMSPEPDDIGVVQHNQQGTKHSNVTAIEADEGFTNIDTYNDDDDTLVQMYSPPKPTVFDAPAEQQQRPSPAKASAAILSTNITAQRPEMTVLEDQCVLSKPAEAREMPDRGRAAERSPQKPRKPAPVKKEAPAQVASNDHEAVTQPRVKRPLPTEDEIKPAAKRSKADVNVENIVDRGRRRTQAAQPALHPDVVDYDAARDRAAETMPPPAAPAKPLKVSKKPSPILAETVDPAPPQRVKGRSRRQTTHGSQTVDVYGSPVPSQMIVGHTRTVLETYSQQAGVVSDQDAVEKTLQRQRTQVRADRQQLDDDLRYSIPQSHQPEPLSSNTKPVPAAPQAASNVVPKLHLTQSQSEKLLGNRHTLAKMLDPFSSSNNGVATEGSERSGEVMGGMVFQLEEKMKQLGDKPQSDGSESDATVIYTEHPKPQAEPNQRPASTSTSSEYDAEMSDDDMAKLRAITTLTRRRQQQDPDKTLVNDEDMDESQEYVKDAQVQQHSQHELEDLELSDPASDDLMAWRKTLKPHQLNLFQELINTARRLTDYFVEQENSVLRNVEKAHRQKIYAIKQEEMARAKTYQAKKEELKRLRKSKKKELKQCQANLLEKLEQKKREKEGRVVQAAQWAEDDDNLEALISKLS